MSHVNKLKCSSNDVWQHMQRLLMWEVHPSLGVLESHWSHSHRHVAPSWLTSATQNPVPSQTKYRPFIINHMACPNWYPVGKGLFGTNYWKSSFETLFQRIEDSLSRINQALSLGCEGLKESWSAELNFYTSVHQPGSGLGSLTVKQSIFWASAFSIVFIFSFTQESSTNYRTCLLEKPLRICHIYMRDSILAMT